MVAAVGLHPNDVGTATPASFAEIERLAELPEVAAVGETGLDYYRERTPHAEQRDALDWHLHLAERLHKPVVIHNREADTDIAEHLEASAARRPSGEIPGVLHCFSSRDRRFLERMLAAGYFVSFAGPLTYRSAEALRTMAQYVPLPRLLVETDCPYLPPEPHRGQRNEPAYVRLTVERLAAIRGAPLPDMAHHLWTNSLTLFPALQGATAGTA
jgi:TatD DNase family protein